jgi:hypothetical protein
MHGERAVHRQGRNTHPPQTPGTGPRFLKPKHYSWTPPRLSREQTPAEEEGELQLLAGGLVKAS